MIKNFFLVAYRNLKRNRIFSVINILGLATGMASAMLIFLWINDEMSFDRFHAKEDRLFQAYREEKSNGQSVVMENSPQILAQTLKTEFPDIEDVVRWQNMNFLLSVGDRHFNVPGNFTDSGFLNMFSFPVLEGIRNYRLSDPTGIVITESLATKLFGKESAVGKQIRLDSVDFFVVKAVLKDLPDNTQFRFEYLLPWTYLQKIGWANGYWENNSLRTFYTLKPGVSSSAFDAKIKNLIVDHTKHEQTPSNDILFGHPAAKWHLYSKFENGREAGGRISVVRLFSLIASFILLIACINFMNLSTARSEKRAREVGIRKVVGAQKKSLIGQFLAESILMAFIAGIFAVIILQLCLPAFNQLVQKQLLIDYGNFYFWVTGIGFVLLTGIIAGSYPAFFLSSLKPVIVLKGTFKKVNATVTPRKVLVVIQFTFAIALIICTLIVEQQIKFAQSRETGYNKNNLGYVFIQGDIDKNYSLIKNELLSSGVATAISKTQAPLTQNWSSGISMNWQGKDPNAKIQINRYTEDGGLVKTAGMQLMQGRDIDIKNYPSDSTACLISEDAVKAMGFKDPIGQLIFDDPINWHVVGVIKDFILESPYETIKPFMIKGPKYEGNVIHIKLNNANTTSQNLAKTEKIFKQYNSAY